MCNPLELDDEKELFAVDKLLPIQKFVTFEGWVMICAAECTSNTITQVVNSIGTTTPAPSVPIVPESEIAEAVNFYSELEIVYEDENDMDKYPAPSSQKETETPITLTLDAITTEAEPSITPATILMIKIGSECQRLGTTTTRITRV